MRSIDQWPLWLQLLIGIPNAIVMTILLVWWPKDEREFKRFEKVAIPYLVLALVFYFLFVRKIGG